MSEICAGPLLFDERQWLAAWALGLMLGAPLPALLPTLFVAPATVTFAIALAVVGIDLGVLLLLGTMQTRVDARGLHVSFGLFGWIRFDFPKENLRSALARRYRPLGEFGGWGIRGFGTRRALNMRGNEGVQIAYLRDGRDATVLVGSQRPQELEHALRLLAVPPPPERP